MRMIARNTSDPEYNGVHYFFTVKFHKDGSRDYAVTVDGDRMTEWFPSQEKALAQFKEMVDA